MTYELVYTRRAARDLDKLDQEALAQINPVCRMHSRLLLLALGLLFSACATTVTLKPTDTVRNAATTETSVTTRFREIQPPSSENPNLEIAVVRQVTREETFQRRHVEKQVLKPGLRTALWLASAAAVGGGYILYKKAKGASERRDVHVGYWIILNQRVKNEAVIGLGQNLMGLGALVALGSELVVAGMEPVGEEWKSERRILPTMTLPAATTDVVTSAGSSSWIVQTDDKGQLAVDVSMLVDMAEPGMPLPIHFALQEDPTQKATFFIPTDVLAHYQPPPPPSRPSIPIVFDSTEIVEDIIIEEPGLDSFEWQPPAEYKSTLAILDFEGLGVSEQEARVLTNRLGTHLVQLGRYQVIERGQMQRVLAEQDFQLTGCISDECAVEIGQLLGCEQMLAGSFGKLGTMYTIDMRIIDVGTGGILRSTSYDVQGDIDLLLTEGLAQAVQRITSGP